MPPPGGRPPQRRPGADADGQQRDPRCKTGLRCLRLIPPEPSPPPAPPQSYAGFFNGFHEKVFEESCGVQGGGFWGMLQRGGVAKISKADLPSSPGVPAKEAADADLARVRRASGQARLGMIAPVPSVPVRLSHLSRGVARSPTTLCPVAPPRVCPAPGDQDASAEKEKVDLDAETQKEEVAGMDEGGGDGGGDAEFEGMDD